MANENLKKIVQPKKRKRIIFSYFFCAGLAGSIAAWITCPLDNIKTKLQTQLEISNCENPFSLEDQNKEKGVKKKLTELELKNFVEPKIKYINIFSTIRQIYIESGLIHGFYRGVTARILCVCPSVAISWGGYEFLKNTFNKLFKI